MFLTRVPEQEGLKAGRCYPWSGDTGVGLATYGNSPCPVFSPPARGPGRDWVHPKARAQQEASQPLSRCPPASFTSVMPHWGGPQETASSMLLFNRHLMTTSECRVSGLPQGAGGKASLLQSPPGRGGQPRGTRPRSWREDTAGGLGQGLRPLSPLFPGKDSAPGEGGWTERHTYPCP